MKRAVLIAALLAAGLTSCTGAARETLPAPASEPWSFSEAADAIRMKSCPEGALDSFATTAALTVQPVSLGSEDDIASALDGLTFQGGWSLETPYASFGGLSGLKALEDGNLLAVSDAGAMIALPFDQDELHPIEQMTLTFLTDEEGNVVSGKSEADAEGLEVRDGIAFVSFERDHRVAAYAYELCGGAARAVTIARIPSSGAAGLGPHIADNGGAEALALADGKLLVGLETLEKGDGPMGEVRINGTVSFEDTPRIEAGRTPLVGLDVSRDVRYSLHRAYNPLTRKNRIRIAAQRRGGPVRTLAELGGGLDLDNFEGIAVWPLADGRDRIFIISDDNFSENQRTLLYVFETAG